MTSERNWVGGIIELLVQVSYTTRGCEETGVCIQERKGPSLLKAEDAKTVCTRREGTATITMQENTHKCASGIQSKARRGR